MVFFIGILLSVGVFLWLFTGGNFVAAPINLIWVKYENLPLMVIVTTAFSLGFLIAYILGLFSYFHSMIKDMRIKNLEKAISDQQTRMINLEETLAKERVRVKELESGKTETRLTVPNKKTGIVAVIKDNMKLSKWFPTKNK